MTAAVRAAVAALTPAIAVCVAGCTGPAASPVRLGFRMAPGSDATYDVVVDTTVVTRIGAPSERRHDRVRFIARQSVLAGSDRRVNVDIASGGTTRHYVARLDRFGGLAALESVDGLPATIDGDLGPAEIFPGATGAIPARRLRPRDQWRIDQQLALPGYRGRLRGRGRLVGLRAGPGTARVASSTTLPVQRTINAAAGAIEMIGSHHTVTDTDYDVHTGAIVRARATSEATYVVVIPPPPGTTGESVKGRLTVRVKSTSVRRSPFAARPAGWLLGVAPENDDEVGIGRHRAGWR